MSTRPELSKKNDYWICKHRYYELKHFCLQYDNWNKFYKHLTNSTIRKSNLDLNYGSGVCFPVQDLVEKSIFYKTRMDMVKNAAILADPELSDYILKAVIKNLSYTTLRAKYNLPCGKDYYYKLYRKFFYILDKERK